MKKYAVYQVFTRLFGNTVTNNIPWGTIEQNGVGKFADFTDIALKEIKALGMTHVWFTGVPHHAVIRDYSELGIEHDHPAVVKGRAGSPYAVKDYYSVNPDLAIDPANRMEEFEALIERTHKAGLKVIIDIVPNHVARNYKGLNNPAGVSDFGAHDVTSRAYHKHNNFYYVPDQEFETPDIPDKFQPLGTNATLTHCQPYHEFPAKWTGNGATTAKPNFDDWYETAKINYGIRPDGCKDFDELPPEFATKDAKAHAQFWQDKPVPNSWQKFRDIALFWLDKGVDGFRYDMAEMVPVEFWSYMNSAIKCRNEDAFLLAEVYQPHLYRDYIQLGKMDYLYDKVDLYDTLKAIIQNRGHAEQISHIEQQYADISSHLLRFLDNHDEQRLAHPEFAGDANFGRPAMLISALSNSAPSMIYFGQEVGEPGLEEGGFGQPSRTSIFDYVGVPHHQRWMNGGKFDGGALSKEEISLRTFYQSLMNFALEHPAIVGEYHELYLANKEALGQHCYLFARSAQTQFVIAAANLNAQQSVQAHIEIDPITIKQWQLSDGEYSLTDQLGSNVTTQLTVKDGKAILALSLEPFAALALTL
ncbi:alpha-amylase family protein [Vibrio sp. SCSIO 43136]|uniref:alpha-amylase family protein n=1 Tax=Vibrio sp. SCSIO 43136 TaxID=2819101 RepID=UPI002076243C|nr:alpha-amylase family protein [Vibrio sp. SCSIO 43136]USD67982.1 alpha-amylase family protein [Vibrio sp. SCSIO 43136]